MQLAKSNNSKIREELVKFNLISESALELMSLGTRDNSEIEVFRDKTSGVIFHDFYLGEDFYRLTSGGFDGLNRSSNLPESPPQSGIRYELHQDSQRRCKDNLPFIANRLVLDYGFGEGWFLKNARHLAREVCGVELNSFCCEKLKSEGINCWSHFPKNIEVDTVTMFHTLEHMPSQIEALSEVYNALKNSSTRQNFAGLVIVEVPHARDFLLTSLESKEFRKYTLRSDHCVLHTRESLLKFMNHAGFERVSIRSVQRYPLSNHLTWLTRNKPGGHMGDLSVIDTNNLNSEYEKSLANIDATDTLVAFGWVGAS